MKVIGYIGYIYFCLTQNVILAIKLEEAKVQKSIKDAAKKGQKDVCTILAKEIIQSRKAVNKIYSAKAQLNSVDMQMKNQLGIIQFLFNFILSFILYFYY